jgi:hypothetical protein
MSCETAYKSSPVHWKRYAVREVLGMRPPTLRDNPGCRGRALAQERSGSLEEVVAPRSDAMHSSSDVKTKSAALRLERTNLHPKPPIVRRGSRRQTRVVLYPCKRTVIGRAAAIDINSFSHLYSWFRREGTDSMWGTMKRATRSAVGCDPDRQRPQIDAWQHVYSGPVRLESRSVPWSAR